MPLQSAATDALCGDADDGGGATRNARRGASWRHHVRGVGIRGVGGLRVRGVDDAARGVARHCARGAAHARAK